jgi:carbamoyltransferase
MMATRIARTGPRFRLLGKFAFGLTYALMRFAGALARLHSPYGSYANRRIASMRQAIERGETVFVLGIGPGGHNAGVGLIEASKDRGIRLVANHEEERFRAIKHFQRYPSLSVDVLLAQMKRLGIDRSQIYAACASWDYPYWAGKAAECVVQELPGSWRLLTREASPQMNVQSVLDAFTAPRRLGRKLCAKAKRMPVIGMRHHDNHAWFSWGVSPFARSDAPVMVLVIDGAGDDAAISAYVGENRMLRLIYKNDSFWDSLGMMYGIVSSSQGGWPVLSSEGRYMGAAAWGDFSRATNRYYQGLRDLFVLESEGRVLLNRSLANWHRGGCSSPYTKRLSRLIGEPIAPKDMWHPDAVLRVEDIRHAPITSDRVDKAAAVQLVFEDALFHIVEHLIRTTRSTRLVMTGGTALNCVANMRLLERFGADWYERNLGMEHAALHLWVPPVPGDAGVSIGAAYHFACLAGARPGESLQHAFYCGMPTTQGEIEEALAQVTEIGYLRLGNISTDTERERIADLLAYLIAHDAVVGIHQGAAETGPRALGHRSILANPTNERTRTILNERVKHRELIRPLAPMSTPEAARMWFELSPGASDDDYNAYNYMVLTCKAKAQAHARIPAVIHFDGTCRLQIVREHLDPFIYAYLKAMGRRVGVEVSVNTSLNVGSPIAQSPVQALQTLKRSKGMHGLFMIGDEGDAYVAWHDVDSPPKDCGQALRRWIHDWAGDAPAAAPRRRALVS